MQLGELSSETRKGLCGRPCLWYFNIYRKENIQKSSYLIVWVHLLCLKMLGCFSSCAPNSRENQPTTVFLPRTASFLSGPGANRAWLRYGTNVRVPTCSLTEARMEEVVSVSDLSPLAAGITGATMAPFSCSTGCSGTGITIVNTNVQEKMRNKKPGCKQTLLAKLLIKRILEIKS